MSTFNELIDFTRSTTATYLDSVVYGDEVVTNGDFSDGLSGWLPDPNASVINGQLVIDGINQTQSCYQNITNLKPNTYYKFECDTLTDGSYIYGYSSFSNSFTITGFPVYNLDSQNNKIKQFVVFKTTDTGQFRVRAYALAGHIAIFDNVSVKEVIGGQVSGTPLLRTAAVDEPRLEYDAQGNALGLLIEEARTNHLVRSQAFDNNAWSKNFATVTANQIAAPDGTTTGLKVNESADPSFHFIHTAGFSFTSVQQYTHSLYAKSGTNHIVQLLGTAVAFGSQAWANFDLSDGTIGSKGTATAATIQSVGGGWYRCSITITVTDTASGSACIIALVPTKTSSRVSSYEGNPSNYIYAWGSQLELGAFPTSYIPTEASTVTRTSEGARVTLSKFHYRQKHGAIVIEFTSKYDETASNFHRPWELGNPATDVNRIFMYVTGDETRLSSKILDNNVEQFFASLTAALPNNTGVYSKAAIT